MWSRMIFVLVVLSCLSSCDYYLINNYKQRVGHIASSEAIAAADLDVCFEEVLFPSHYNRTIIQYIHGKDSLTTFFYKNYDNHGITNESGYITVKFVINCEGKTGRYQVLETGIDYSEKHFHEDLITELLELTQEMDEWTPFYRGDSRFDSFHHLTFKIQNGELDEILP